MIRAEPPRVYLVTGPVQTGKTTRLRAWCDERSDVDGILAPVVDGRRHLLHIRSGAIRNLEDVSGGAAKVTVRRYTFNADVFAWARNCLLGAASDPGQGINAQPRWIIVDEVGPLELSGGGLEPAVSALLGLVLNNPLQVGGNLLRVVLVIREHLVDDALKHFGVSPAQIDRFPFV
ncbi:MAG: hypothetical protein KAU31_06860 [Spirochaetaceae bacterium]|nr:hypothetical protein [Spirochaetaceae bacterium]